MAEDVKWRVTVKGIDYEVTAPDEQTAWEWANYTHEQEMAAKKEQPSQVQLPQIPEPLKTRDASSPFTAIAEPAAQMASGMAGSIVGGYRGLVDLASGRGINEAADRVREAQEEYTWQPRTTAGQTVSKAISYPFEKGIELSTEAGGVVGNVFGNEAAGKFFGEVAPQVAMTLGMAKPMRNMLTKANQSAQGIITAAESAKASAAIEKTQVLAKQQEAAQLAQERGITLNPAESNPSFKNRVMANVAGAELNKNVAASNIGKAENIARKDLMVEKLDAPSIKARRAEIAAPIEELKGVGVIQPSATLSSSLSKLLPDDLAGMEGGKKITKIVNNIIDKTKNGVPAEQLWNTVRTLRSEGSKGFHSSDVKVANVSQAKIKIANALEDMIDQHLTKTGNTELLGRVRAARAEFAKSYAYESVLSKGTERLNMSKLAKMVEADNALSGEIKSLATIAANYPHAFKVNPTGWEFAQTRLSRTGLPGTIAGVTSEAFGIPYYLGAPIGSAIGEISGMLAERRLTSPGYQAANAIPQGLMSPLPAGMFVKEP